MVDPEWNADVQHETSRQRETEREQAAQAPPPYDEFHGVAGIQSAVEVVRDLEFPATIQDIWEQAGDRPVFTSEDHAMSLQQVLSDLDETEFASLRDFETAVQKHWVAIEYEELPPEQRQEGPGANVEEHED